jgi:phage terminase large subunit-like protein
VDKDSIGGKAGDLLRLRDWQQLQLYRLFARREDGRRKHRMGLFGLPRKNGKSAIGAATSLFEADQGPDGGEVYCVAGDREQARIVFGTARRMVETDPDLSGRVKPYKNEMVWTQTGTRLRVLSAEAYTKEGLNPTFVLFDEVHVQPDDELWDVMALAMGAREEPMMLGITTAGAITDRTGNDSLCYRLYQLGKRVALGETDDPSFFFSWWEPRDRDDDEPIDHNDPDVWAEANPGLGDLVSLEDFQSALGRTHESVFRTKRCNMWVSGKETALPTGRWEACREDRPADGEVIEFSSGEQVPTEWLDDAILFLDGSWAGDSTGIVACTPDSYLYVVTHHERTEVDGPEWRVPVTSVEADVVMAIDAGARGILVDPHRWQRTIAVLEEAGYPVAEWHTNNISRIVPAWKDFYAAVLDQELHHDGNLALARHIGNMILKIDAHGARPVKHRPSVRHIDLGICAIGAYANRDVQFGDDKPERSALWSMAV